MVVIEALLMRFQPSFLQLWARILWKLPLVLGRQVASARQGWGLPALGKRTFLPGDFQAPGEEERV